MTNKRVGMTYDCLLELPTFFKSWMLEERRKHEPWFKRAQPGFEPYPPSTFDPKAWKNNRECEVWGTDECSTGARVSDESDPDDDYKFEESRRSYLVRCNPYLNTNHLARGFFKKKYYVAARNKEMIRCRNLPGWNYDEFNDPGGIR